MAAVNVAVATETNPLRQCKGRRKGEQERQITRLGTQGMHEGLSSIHVSMFHYRQTLVSFKYQSSVRIGNGGFGSKNGDVPNSVNCFLKKKYYQDMTFCSFVGRVL
jgi:hypothetical protein